MRLRAGRGIARNPEATGALPDIMIILDTETTELMKPEVADVSAQPSIIEIALIKLNAKYEEIDRYTALLQPSIPINEEEHKRITKLTNEDLEGQPLFVELYPELCDFFIGERTLIAHNLIFDRGVLIAELQRIGKEFAFPWPPDQVCSVDRTRHYLGRRLKLTELYQQVLKKPLAQTHRAMGDATALAEIVRKLKMS
jgi:DNA polymerase III epsilon subunit-like protein